MTDIFLTWNSDLAVDANGGVLLADNHDLNNQRIIRRLLTNSGDYLWNLSYGGSLSLAVGSPIQAAVIEATIRQQLAMEAAVQPVPAPLVDVKLVDPARGAYSVDISYSDSATGGSAKVSITER